MPLSLTPCFKHTNYIPNNLLTSPPQAKIKALNTTVKFDGIPMIRISNSEFKLITPDAKNTYSFSLKEAQWLAKINSINPP